MNLKLVCLYIFLLIFIRASASLASETYEDLYVGCFIDDPNDRVLPDGSSNSSEMTIQLCIEYCTGLSDVHSAYAGVEFANECYCGVAGINYSRLGVAKDNGCNFGCAGNLTTICGGSGTISIYDLLLISSPTTTETVSSSVIATSHDASTASDTPTKESNESIFPMSTHSTTSDPSTFAGIQSTLMTSSLQPVTGDKSGIGLYAGAGGGGAFLLILIIIIIVFVTCRRKNTEKRSAATDHSLTTMIPSKNDNQERNRPAGQEEDPCYENKCAETERDYENMTVVDTREYINLPDAMDNKEITYMNSKKRSAMEKATHDPAALYAMPDLSAKTSSRPKTYTSPPNGTDDPSLLYAMPDKRAKTVYSTKGKPALEESLDALYTTSMKNRLEPIGMEASTDGEGLYALPDKNPRDHVTRNGAGKLDDNVEAMYAMPEKSRRGSDVDNTVMIENDIYSST